MRMWYSPSADRNAKRTSSALLFGRPARAVDEAMVGSSSDQEPPSIEAGCQMFALYYCEILGAKGRYILASFATPIMG
jgi:hypothetical protein